MAEASDDTSTNIQQINKAVGDMDDVMRGNKNIAQNAASYSVSLQGRVKQLNELVSYFQVGRATESPEKVVALESPASYESTGTSDAVKPSA